MANSVSNTALLLIAAVPVLSGTALTALFALLAQRRIDKREHARWVRERRYETYQAFLSASMHWHLTARQYSTTEEDPGYLTAMFSALQNAQAIASQKVYDALEDVVHAVEVPKDGSNEGFTMDDILGPMAKKIGAAHRVIRAELIEGSQGVVKKPR